MLTVRAAPAELKTASIDPRTVRFPPPWHSWSALDAVAGSPRPGLAPGLAVGSATSGRVGVAGHGPPQPAPTQTFHRPPPAGLICTARPAATSNPDTVNGDPEVTITALPSFSVSATRTSVAARAGERLASAVPP